MAYLVPNEILFQKYIYNFVNKQTISHYANGSIKM
jgi:hypothetical protein